MDLVEITWADSYGVTSSWEDFEDVDCPPLLIKSVGYIALDKDDYIVLASNITIGEHPHCGTKVVGLISIPKCSIKETNWIYQQEKETK